MLRSSEPSGPPPRFSSSPFCWRCILRAHTPASIPPASLLKWREHWICVNGTSLDDRRGVRRLTADLVSLQKLFDLIPGWQGGAGTQAATLQCRNCVAQSHARLKVFAAQHAVDESTVKSIAGAGRVATTTGYFKGRRFDELSFAVTSCAARAQRGPDNRTTITGFELDQCCAFVADARQSMRELGGGD